MFMYIKPIKYTDYAGVERTEDFYFNLSKAEIIEKELGTYGGYGSMLEKIVEKKDGPLIMSTFKNLIMESYGERSEDGKRFVKSKELSIAFTQTEAYSVLLEELCTDAAAGAEFVNGIMPKEPITNAPHPATQK
jgi:hypothetical protein